MILQGNFRGIKFLYPHLAPFATKGITIWRPTWTTVSGAFRVMG